MIRIKDYIFQEKDIKEIWYDSIGNKLRIDLCNCSEYKYIKATFEDIQWEYDRFRVEADKDGVIFANKILEKKIKDLEEEHKELVETNYNLATKKTELEEELDCEKSICSNQAQRILKAIEYIEEHKRNAIDFFGEPPALEELEQIKDLLKILKGEE